MTWDAAKTFCEGKGGILVEVDSQAEQDALAMKSAAEFWIGLKRESGNWRWQSSGRQLEGGFTNWKSGQPSADDTCAKMKIHSSVYKWEGKSGSEGHYPLCEQSKA